MYGNRPQLGVTGLGNKGESHLAWMREIERGKEEEEEEEGLLFHRLWQLLHAC